MERIQFLQDKAIDFHKQNPRAAQIAFGLTGLYIANKVYKKWKYSQRLFTQRSDIEQKVILITGCDTGFGSAIALKLSVEEGYRVIATCLKQDSIEQMQSNEQYTKNGSVAVLMDVTKEEDIERVKQFTIQYLAQTDGLELWGVVNNAGISMMGSFELVPKELAEYQMHILYKGPIDICRAFLPLLPGRKNWKQLKSGSIAKTSSNGGRIVNMASAGARFIVSQDIRYGPMKSAVLHFSHALRMDVSPRFGIWVASVEPGAYMTPIVTNSLFWWKQTESKVKKNNESELLDIYDFPDLNKLEKLLDEAERTKGKSIMYGGDIREVVDAVIHGLIAKYPHRSYAMGWSFLLQCFVYLPLWMTESIRIKLQKKMFESVKKD